MDLIIVGSIVVVVVILIAVFIIKGQLQFQQQVVKQFQTLNNSINNQLSSSQQTLNERLGNTVQVVNDVQNKLGKLDEQTKRIFDIGKDIASLQDILKAPKIRGTLGELFLGDLLAQILPKEHYELQYSFKSREQVDAVVKLMQGLVPIDSKFPLESFKRFCSTEEEQEKKQYKKEFVKAVKKHIDDIASKYILPEEGTFDFALMYIPAENVYYETIIRYDNEKDALWQYALDKRVIPVSPNSFVAYLQSIVLGLKGLKIESSVKEVIQKISALKTDYIKFINDFDKLGTHLKNATNSYDISLKRAEKFSVKLDSMETIQSKSLPQKD